MRFKIAMGLAAVGLSMASDAAMAADMPLKARRYQPAAPYFNWTGFYVGGVAGYASGTSQHIVPTTIPGPLAGLTASDPFKVTGGLFGLTLGYNYQFSNWVIGIEGDYSLSTKSGVHGSAISLLNPLFTVSTSEKSLMTIRGRVGYAWDRFLAYGTFGWASARVEAGEISLLSSLKETKTMNGYVVGLGLEYAFLSNWSAKLEYLHVKLDTTEFFNPNSNPGGRSSSGVAGQQYHSPRRELPVRSATVLPILIRRDHQPRDKHPLRTGEGALLSRASCNRTVEVVRGAAALSPSVQGRRSNQQRAHRSLHV
jgi:outer membrane immunogenic protein